MIFSTYISGLLIFILTNSIHSNILNVYKNMLNCSQGYNPITFINFMRYQEIQCYLLYLAESNPNIVTFGNATAKSHENRLLSHIIISCKSRNTKPMIMIEAGIHAREWVSPAVALYVIHKLVEDPYYRTHILNIDWLIMPMANPDGYEYSHTNKRFWRKNRAKGNYCFGVDLNRNFDVSWGLKDSSSNECSETYAGEKVFSEPETKYLRNVVDAYKHRIKMYLTLHSYGPSILYPYSYTKNKIVNNLQEHITFGNIYAKAVKNVYGTTYEVGDGAKELGEISGTSDDWAKVKLNIPLSFTIELPPGGKYDFDLPPEDIIPRVRESFEGIIAMSKHLRYN